MTPRMAPTAACLLALAALLGGCGGPPAPTAPPGAPPGYEALRETFGPADFGPLQGRVVVLDPGHGGLFRGALGPNGLTEAEVNLGVALHLRGLLEWAGTSVHLTRTADRDFLTPSDSTLTSDLAFRVSIRDSVQPDVFISIHHNSNASYDPTINETQTYHPLGADGASLDLARAIHRHLVQNLEISPARILPGNFRVLRDATVPAVLGEPAMISHPEVARRLSLASKQRLEAEAYFLGLLEYFTAGDPGWRSHQPDTLAVDAAGTDLRWTFLSERRPGTDDDATPGPDPATFELRRDGLPVPHRLSADCATVWWTAPPLPGGAPAVITLHGRNLAGRAAPVSRTVLLPAAAATVEVALRHDGVPADTSRTLVGWVAPGGAPLPMGHLAWPDGPRLRVTPDGVPEALLPTTALAGAPVFEADDGRATDVAVSESSLPAGWSWLPVAGPPPAEPWQPRIIDQRMIPPVAGRVAVPYGPEEVAFWTAPGRRALAWAHPHWPPHRDQGPRTASLTPALEGLVVVIDPAGGGIHADQAGPGGLRGAEVNLGVARQLARLLTGLGVRAVLTRDGSTAPGAVAKVALAERVDADLFLTIGRLAPGDTVRVQHHPGSRVGVKWAASSAEALGLLLGMNTAGKTGPSWAYLLRHTSCPALEVRLSHAATLDDGLRLASPAWQAAEARALLRGLALAMDPELASAYEVDALLRRQCDQWRGPGRFWGRVDGQVPWYPVPQGGKACADPLASWSEPGLPLGGALHILEHHDGILWSIGQWHRKADGWGYAGIWNRPARSR